MDNFFNEFNNFAESEKFRLRGCEHPRPERVPRRRGLAGHGLQQPSLRVHYGRPRERLNVLGLKQQDEILRKLGLTFRRRIG